MPDKNVQLPDGRVVAFPDSMSDDDIGKVIKQQMAPTEPTAAPKEKPGFIARTSESFGTSQHPVDQLIGELKRLKEHPVDTLWETVKAPVIGLRDLTYGLVTHPIDTVQSVTGGREFAADVEAGNYKGALGTLAGKALQVGTAKIAPAEGAATSVEEMSLRNLPKEPGVVATKVADKLATSAETQYQKALNPTKERTKFIAQKRTGEMLDRGITAKSPSEMAQTAGDNARTATKSLNDLYESFPADRKSPTAPMIKALDDYKTQFQDRIPVSEQEFRDALAKNKGEAPPDIVKGEDGSLTRVVNLDPHAVQAAESLQATIKQYGDSITPASMRKARQVFDESVARAGGYEGRSLAEGSLVDARKEAATAIREQLAKDNPELAPLNAEVNFWLDVQRIAKETAKRRVGQQGGLTVEMAKRSAQVAGAGVGYQVGGPFGAAVGGYLAGDLAAKLARVTQSTQWRTVSAVAKNNLAKSLASGNFREASFHLSSMERQLGIPAATAATSEAAKEANPQP